MKTIIIGAGGFAKELIFLTHRLKNYDVVGFVDDNYRKLPTHILGYPVLGGIDYLEKIDYSVGVVIGIAKPSIKESIYEKIKNNPKLVYPNLIDPTALIGTEIEIGVGNVIMPYSTFTASIKIGNFNMINIHSTLGHDTNLTNFNTIFPNVNISGNISIGCKNEFGVGTKVIPSTTIGNSNIFGAGTVVIRDINDNSKIVGVPGKVIESWD